MGCRVEEQLHCTVVIVRSKDITGILSQPYALLHFKECSDFSQISHMHSAAESYQACPKT